jgi:hypothetical protein
MNYVSAVELGIRTRAGYHTHAEVDVCNMYVAHSLPLTKMPFTVLMVWREQKYHSTKCDFCLTKIDGHNSKSKHAIVYPSIPSALRPVEYEHFVPIPNPPQ